MDMSKRIGQVCKESNDSARGVLPPQVCKFCFQCPIATLVAGVTDDFPIPDKPRPIPEEHVTEVKDWLNKVEADVHKHN